MADRLGVVVLAAGRMEPELQRVTGVAARALIAVGGKPIIDRMLEVLRHCQWVGEVRVVCAPGSPLLKHVGELGVVAEGPGYVDSIRSGLRALGSPEWVLVVTGDLPLLTPEALDGFYAQALQSGAAIVYPIIRREVSEQAFPGGRRTYVRLREGAFTGGNIALLSRRFIEQEGERLSAAFAGRKSPLRLAKLLGLGFVARYLLGGLSVTDIATQAEKLLGVDVHVLECPWAEIGFDVDKVSNLQTVERQVAGMKDEG